MSLIPYHPREGREIVLRHHNAIVVRDPSSHRLEIRGLQITECPTCHQPLRSGSPERHFEDPTHRETYVNPDYFRMLRSGTDRSHTSHADPRPPSSPVRRLVEPVRLAARSDDDDDEDDEEIVSSAPTVKEGSRIRREAFSPNYFNAFFTEEAVLGKGSKGVVLLVRHEIDGCHLGHFACKRVPVGDDHAWLEKVMVEVELLAKLSHPNLVSYRHVWLEDVQLTRFGPSVACAFILQQYCNSGDLHNHVIGDMPGEMTKEQLKERMRRRSKCQSQTDRPDGQFQRTLPFEEIYSLFKDITSGLAYLHEANYIHRDLKPSNCLLHREGKTLVCLISDFGEVQPEDAVRMSTGSTGTISYCAPEVLKADAVTGLYGNFTAKSDIFSLGMILYFMCFGRLPYRSANAMHEELEDIDLLRAEITNWKGFEDERRERPDLPSKLYQLLKRLLSVHASERPTANEVLYAMKSESIQDRPGTNPTAGRRIQNLDSPAPPSTPVTKRPDAEAFDWPESGHTPSAPSDVTKQAYVVNTPEDDTSENSPQPTVQNSLQKHAASELGSPRHRSHAVASRERSHRGRSSFPQKPPRTANVVGPSVTDRDDSRQPSPGITTPLLMPPPTTTVGRMRHTAQLARYRATRWLYRRADAVVFTSRLALFLAKFFSLSALCWPFGVRPGVGASLVLVAAMDLGVPTAAGGGGGGGSWWCRWDWRVSALLLVLHFAVLSVMTRFGALCASAGHRLGEPWGAW